MIKNRSKLYLGWTPKAWQQYLTLAKYDKKYLKRINKLIKSIIRDGHRRGLGKPEPLRHIKSQQGAEVWSRRITKKYRLVYIVPTSLNQHTFVITATQYH